MTTFQPLTKIPSKWWFFRVITAPNGTIFRVTGPLCGEFTGHQWIPLTNASDAELWCCLWSCAWINHQVNNREAGDLRRRRAHYDITVMVWMYQRALLNYLATDGKVRDVSQHVHLHFPDLSSHLQESILKCQCQNCQLRKKQANIFIILDEFFLYIRIGLSNGLVMIKQNVFKMLHPWQPRIKKLLITDEINPCFNLIKLFSWNKHVKHSDSI